MRNLALLLIILTLGVNVAFALPKHAYKIDASRNASQHNNLGVNYLNEHNYYSAIKEFEMAISLNPDTQASATYYNNLGKTYIKIGYPNMAEKAFDDALKLNAMNFEFYQNIVESYKMQKKLDSEFQKAMKNQNPLSRITAGLILIEKGKLEAGINMLDEFCFDEPEMIITKGVRTYIQSIVPNEFR